MDYYALMIYRSSVDIYVREFLRFQAHKHEIPVSIRTHDIVLLKYANSTQIYSLSSGPEENLIR